MTNNNLIRTLLKLKDLKVVNFAINRGSELEIAVKPYKNGPDYPQTSASLSNLFGMGGVRTAT